jgi:hypothetical protein
MPTWNVVDPVFKPLGSPRHLPTQPPVNWPNMNAEPAYTLLKLPYDNVKPPGIGGFIDSAVVKSFDEIKTQTKTPGVLNFWVYVPNMMKPEEMKLMEERRFRDVDIPTNDMEVALFKELSKKRWQGETALGEQKKLPYDSTMSPSPGSAVIDPYVVKSFDEIKTQTKTPGEQTQEETKKHGEEFDKRIKEWLEIEKRLSEMGRFTRNDVANPPPGVQTSNDGDKAAESVEELRRREAELGERLDQMWAGRRVVSPPWMVPRMVELPLSPWWRVWPKPIELLSPRRPIEVPA